MLLVLLVSASMAVALPSKPVVDQFEQNNTQVELQVQCNGTLVFTTGKGPSGGLMEDCADYYVAGFYQNGVYRISPSGLEDGFNVYCDMETDHGGWTVFQRRGNFGNVREYFFRTWTVFKTGFGDLSKDFWLGNDRISAMTTAKDYELKVDLWDEDGEHKYAKYAPFRVENEAQKYKLVTGGYTGTAGDSMSKDNGNFFSTRDRNNFGQQHVYYQSREYYKYQQPQSTYSNYVQMYQGAWWYSGNPNFVNLNGLYLEENHSSPEGIRWETWKGPNYTLSRAEMKIRPDTFVY